MLDVFILKNHDTAYLNKNREWITAGDTKTLFRTTEYDEAVNEKVELTVKDPALRISLVRAEQADNGRILIADTVVLPRASHADKEHAAESQEPAASDTDTPSITPTYELI